jgi:hypothetical protein
MSTTSNNINAGGLGAGATLATVYAVKSHRTVADHRTSAGHLDEAIKRFEQWNPNLPDRFDPKEAIGSFRSVSWLHDAQHYIQDAKGGTLSKRAAVLTADAIVKVGLGDPIDGVRSLAQDAGRYREVAQAGAKVTRGYGAAAAVLGGLALGLLGTGAVSASASDASGAQ